MGQNVLVPVDGSPLSFRALRYALGEHPDAEITAVHVVDLFEPAAGYGSGESTHEPLMGSEEWHRQVEKRTEELFAEVETIGEEFDRDVATVSEVGDPQRLIPDYVEEENVDHVVMGAHGREKPERPLVGRVAETVVHRTTVPVTIIR